MKKKFFIKQTLGLIAIVMLAGCAQLHDLPQTSKLRFQGLFDGADTIHIQGDRLWMRHYAYELPGRWHGSDEPMYINGEKWYPEWKGNDSSVYLGVSPHALPEEPVEVSIQVSSTTWGSVEIWQQPREENDYTLIIAVDDRGPIGAHWYTIDIDW